MSTEKTGCSKSIFSKNQPWVIAVIEEASNWIARDDDMLETPERRDATAA